MIEQRENVGVLADKDMAEQMPPPMGELAQNGGCDGKCTKEDIWEGMFGYVCKRCHADSLTGRYFNSDFN
jgi:hypothetical protein